LQKARDWADLALKIISSVAIVVGGWWAYYQFRVTDSTASNIQIGLATEIVKYSEDYRLLVIHVKPKNIGKVPVSPGKGGLIVSVRPLPTTLKAGAVDLEKPPELHNANLITRFPDGYELEPGVEYDEVEALVVPKSGLYAVKATMDLGDNTEIDQTTVTRVE
jgi:hypothetical protein